MPAYIPSSDLKTILHSKRANLYYLEHCRILVNGGRVEYVTEQGKESLYWNIPIANTTCILLGTGTSVTQAAVRELSKAGVVIGFCGGGGTPLFAGCEVEFFSPQSEYRPTEYLQCWCDFWFDDAKRLAAAKHLQAARLKTVAQIWLQTDWQPDSDILNGLLRQYEKEFQTAPDNQSLLAAEGRFTAKLYSIANRATLNDATFKRSTRGESGDAANKFLDHGNYLAYGLGATACWVLGLPTVWRCCTAKRGAAAWYSTPPTSSKTRSSCRRPLSARPKATTSASSANAVSNGWCTAKHSTSLSTR